MYNKPMYNNLGKDILEEETWEETDRVVMAGVGRIRVIQKVFAASQRVNSANSLSVPRAQARLGALPKALSTLIVDAFRTLTRVITVRVAAEKLHHRP
jgi:hypothetical protein